MAWVAVPREKSRCRLQYCDHLLVLGVLLPEFTNRGGLLGGDALVLAGIHPTLRNPLAGRLGPHAKPSCERGNHRPVEGVLPPVIDYQPDCLLHGLRVPSLCHEPSIHMKKVSSTPER